MDTPGTFGIVLWVLFAAAVLLSATLGVVLAYHWSKYATNPTTPIIASAVYAAVAFVLLIALLALVFSI